MEKRKPVQESFGGTQDTWLQMKPQEAEIYFRSQISTKARIQESDGEARSQDTEVT